MGILLRNYSGGPNCRPPPYPDIACNMFIVNYSLLITVAAMSNYTTVVCTISLVTFATPGALTIGTQPLHTVQHRILK